MYRHVRLLWILCFINIVCACTPLSTPTNTSGLQAITAVPTLDRSDATVLCDVIAVSWDRDWPVVIRALEALNELSADCGQNISTQERLYVAHVEYGKQLEGEQQFDEAIDAYQTALHYLAQGDEAIDSLIRLQVVAPTLAPDCEQDEADAALAAVPRYRSAGGSFIRVNGSGFTLGGRPFSIYGVNYYPRDTPWRRFLAETSLADIPSEFELLQAAGLNTIRIQLRHDLLFQCIGNGAVPIPENIARLDDIIQTATRYDLRLILVLNDAADLSSYPLYNHSGSSDEQMRYLAQRYRDEPAILAWDLRDSGDNDYLSHRFEKRTVLTWLAESAILIRQADPNHLITASWGVEAEATIPTVDFLSFEPSDHLDRLRQQIAVLKAATDKPILLSSIGYNTFGSSEEGQRNSLQAALDAARNNQLAGWLVWTAFDFPLTATCYESGCLSQDSADHHYGLWTSAYEPKLAVGVIQLATQDE
jgi:hypothetical protein